MTDTRKAKLWGRWVFAQMEKRGVRSADVVRGTGIKAETLAAWREGKNLASLDTGLLVADFLESGKLRKLITDLRTYTCKRCQRRFMVNRGLDAMYCSANCRSTLHHRKRNQERSRTLRERNGRQLAVYVDAVHRLCTEWCVNDGMCPDAECPIQQAGKSPLPVDPRRFVPVSFESHSVTTGVAAERIA